MKKRMLILLFLSALVLACASSQDFDPLPGHQPVVHDSYAPSAIRPGDTWRIYLYAEDYEGDMKEIVIFLTQTGRAPFPRYLVRLKGEDTKEVAGYIWLSTPIDSRMLADRLKVKLVVRDRRGNTSQPLEFSLRFDLGPPQEIPEKWNGPANRKLGMITAENITPSQHRPSRGEGL